jgi:hypothetical protein
MELRPEIGETSAQNAAKEDFLLNIETLSSATSATETAASTSQLAMPPPSLPSKRRRRTALELLISEPSTSIESTSVHSLSIHKEVFSTLLHGTSTRQDIDDDAMSVDSSTSNVSISSTSTKRRKRTEFEMLTSERLEDISNVGIGPSSRHSIPFVGARTERRTNEEWQLLRAAVEASGEFEVPNEYREHEVFFDPWTPAYDAVNNLGLDIHSWDSIRNPSNVTLLDEAIFQFLMLIARSSTVRVAVMHPVISTYFEPNRQGIGRPAYEAYRARPEGRIPDACELTYGHRTNFDILLIPIQHQSNQQHWTLGIYDKRVQRFIFFDPLQPYPELWQPWHQALLEHVRNTVYPGRSLNERRKKLIGAKRPAGYSTYNQQDDGYSCGHHICSIANEYVFNDGYVYKENFQPQEFRSEMEEILEPVFNYYRDGNNDQIPPTIADDLESNASNAVRLDDLELESNASGIRRSARSNRSTPSISSVTQSSNTLRFNSQTISEARHRRRNFADKEHQRGIPENREKENEKRRKKKYDPNDLNPEECMGRINYAANEGAFMVSQRFPYPDYYNSGDFDKICCWCKAKLLPNEAYGICCNKGSVNLPLYAAEKKGYLRELMDEFGADYKHFIEHTKPYNNFLAFCSISNHHLPNPNVYHGHRNLIVVNGEIRHNIGDIEPQAGRQPMFAQLYVIEPEHAKRYRASNPLFDKVGCRSEIAARLDADLRTYNYYAIEFMSQYRQYLRAKEHFREQAIAENRNPELIVPRMRITMLNERSVPYNQRERGHHPGTLGMPTNDQVQVAWNAAGGEEPPRALGTYVTNFQGTRMRQVPYWDPNLDGLAYPLIFQEGEQGYKFRHFKLEEKNQMPSTAKTNRRSSARPLLAPTAIDLINMLDQEVEEEDNMGFDEVRLEDPEVLEEQQEVDNAAPVVEDVFDEEREDLVENLSSEEDEEPDTEEEEEGSGVHAGRKGKRKFVSRKQFDRFHLFRRGPPHTMMGEVKHHIYSMHSLGQLLVIDHYLRQMVSNMEYYSNLQQLYRHDNEKHLERQISRQLREGEKLGKITLMSRNQIGGRRYFQQKFMDGCTIYDQVGEANFMLTFTMNAHLPEVERNLAGLSYLQGYDIVCRYFQDKVKELYEDIKERSVFGECVYVIGAREWQKRGLPHVHWNIKIHPRHVRKSPAWVDDFVCAEIPEEPPAYDTSENAQKQRLLRKLVLKLQVHKCNSKSQCYDAEKKACRKGYPKPYSETTDIKPRFPVYRRRAPEGEGEIGHRKHEAIVRVKKNNVVVTNADIVPYNAGIILKYQSHHCLDITNGKASLQYSLGYILKGNDRSYIAVSRATDEEGNNIVHYDEPRAFRLARVAAAPEAFDRTMGYFQVRSNYTVDSLPLHLKDEADITFSADATPKDLRKRLKKSETSKLVSFLKQCQCFRGRWLSQRYKIDCYERDWKQDCRMQSSHRDCSRDERGIYAVPVRISR